MVSLVTLFKKYKVNDVIETLIKQNHVFASEAWQSRHLKLKQLRAYERLTAQVFMTWSYVTTSPFLALTRSVLGRLWTRRLKEEDALRHHFTFLAP
jgi:hypothetical protein